MDNRENVAFDFFGVFKRKQTYLNVLYLFMSFPLGILYFVFLITGLSLGLGLTPILLGIPIIYFVFIASKSLMVFERRMAALLLGISFNEGQFDSKQSTRFFTRLKNEFFDMNSWKALVYLGGKFFAGILAFVLCVTLLSVSLAFILSPLVVEVVLNDALISGSIQYTFLSSYLNLNMSPFEESLIVMVIGFVLLYGSLHFFNLLAYINAKVLEFMSPVQCKIR